MMLKISATAMNPAVAAIKSTTHSYLCTCLKLSKPVLWLPLIMDGTKLAMLISIGNMG
jgi:hypothetical protein